MGQRRILINTIQRNGLDVGDVVSYGIGIPARGKKETPDNGFVSLIMYGGDANELVQPLSNGSEILANRAKKVELDKLGLPMHPFVLRSMKSQGLKAGRGLYKHLKQDRILPLRRGQLLVTDK